MTMTTRADIAVLIGRFQPFHEGHATLLQLALQTAVKVVVVLGSSFRARNAKNPFTWQEREAMIRATLPQAFAERISFVPIRDYYNDTRWSGAVRSAVEQVAGNASRIALVGHFKDASSYYLNYFPQWELVAAENDRNINATAIRQVLYEADNLDVSLSVLADMVPLPVCQFIKAWALLPCYPALKEEYHQLVAYRAAWESAPYPPIFSTGDAVVRAAGHVLLIQRGGFPGKGQWALPGGFIDQHERVLQAAIRELNEETGLAVLHSALENALVDVKVFDHPDRSQRGRTITHAHFFDLKLDSLPVIEAADDAAQASWVPVDRLASMEECFFEDHFHILDSFLQLIND